MDNVSDEYFDATTNTVSETLFTIPNIQPLPANYINFKTMRSHGLIFVDKTAFIKKILELPGSGGKPFVIICRPRRFGKTVFLCMLEQFFLGNKTFFHNTAIAELMPGEWTKYPVIHLSFDFAPVITTLEDVAKFKSYLETTLNFIGEEYGLDLQSSSSIDILIETLSLETGQPVVVLIDEYDKVFLQASDADQNVFDSLKGAVASFYDQIKNQQDNIKLLFITGISRISLYYFESGLSLANMEDLTFEKDFSSAIGFTWHEITTNFGPSLQRLAIQNDMDYPSIVKSIKTRYNGYRFSPEDSTKVFNPISIITAFRKERIDNYWAMGISLHVETMIKSKINFSEFLYHDLSLSKIMMMYQDEHHPNVPLAAVLYNYGYLTILRYNKKSNTVFLAYPNQEIESEILKVLSQSRSDTTYHPAIRKSFQEGDIKNMVTFVNNAVFYNKCRVSNFEMNEGNVTRYIVDTLKNANISVDHSGIIVQGLDHQTKGDLDIILTYPNSIPIMISLEYKCSAVKAINKLIDSAIFSKKKLHQCIGKFSKNFDPVHTQLIGMNVDGKKGESPAIKDWILLPYKDGKVFMNETLANKVGVLENLKNSLLGKAEYWNQTTCADACNVLVWKDEERWMEHYRKICSKI